MLTRALIVLLVVLNLGIASWWWWQPVRQPAPVDARVPGVPLLQLPAESTSSGAPSASRATPAVVEAASVADAPAVPLAPALPLAGNGSGQCYAFGPLQADAPQPGALAHAHGPVRFQPAPEPAAPPRGWRVVMPPQAGAEAAMAMQQRLRAAGFSDQVLVRNPPEANSIALGLFGTREAAQRHRQRLADAGFRAQVHPAGGEIRPALAFELRQGADPDQVRVALGLLRAQPLDCNQL